MVSPSAVAASSMLLCIHALKQTHLPVLRPQADHGVGGVRVTEAVLEVRNPKAYSVWAGNKDEGSRSGVRRTGIWGGGLGQSGDLGPI